MHEDKFWESFAKAADVWQLVVVVLIIALILFIVLRIATRAVADRRTRKFLIEGMQDDSELGEDGEPKKGEPTAKGPRPVS